MGDYITLEQILEFREKKAQMQENLRLRHSGSITVALGMNIPGPHKTDDEIVKAFREGCRTLREMLEQADMSVEESAVLEEQAGNAACFSVSGTDDVDLVRIIKKMMVDLEETHPLGRLFDIDVYDASGAAFGRSQLGAQVRRCLLCDGAAKVCGRSRQHSVEELQRRVQEIIYSWLDTV